ncbi:ornithine cyclodeaminase family protein [Nonomuraea sp. NPDC050556]|uniref:ornithine cyclodeaminase family protein n=1 Tax=Nonomuraea sp. NPDC050556 TaxID=3364369 RepID=UPI00378C1CA3
MMVEAETLRAAVSLGDLIEPVSRAFADYSAGLGETPLAVFAPAGEQGDVHVKSAWLRGWPYFTVKVATWFAARTPATSGYIAVHSAATGDLLALLRDEHHLTDLRTAAAGAIAARLLACPDSTTLTVLGAGTQARLQTEAAAAVLPLERILIWGRNPESARTLATTLTTSGGPVVSAVSDPAEAVRQADVIVTATGSRAPVLHGSWLRPGQHITAVGADDLTKAELDPACFARADVVAVDSRSLAPLFAGDLTGPIDAELGELILGRHPGRTHPAQITVAKLIGLGIQDLAAATVAMEALR